MTPSFAVIRRWTKPRLLPLAAGLGLLLGACSDEPLVQEGCSDGQLGGSEQCDDGNGQSGDGCSDVCTLESGWVCAFEGLSCTAVCGDGIVVGSEACDDGNDMDGDGCSSSCEMESLPEVCDDSEDNDGDGLLDCDDPDCESACRVEDCSSGVDDDGDGQVDCADNDCLDVAPCGDEDTDSRCSDTVDNDGDGSMDCADPDCSDFCFAGECGDGGLNIGEECDDGDDNSDSEPDACRSDCTAAGCGDGVADRGETCDSPLNPQCSSSCTDTPLAACPRGETDLFRFDFEEGAVTSDVVLTLERGGVGQSDLEFPADCGDLSGPELVGLLTVPRDGLWFITAANEQTSTEVALAVLDSCDASAGSIACDVGIGRNGRGEVLVEAAAGDELVVMAEVFGVDFPATVQLRAVLVPARAGRGEECSALLGEATCETGLLCEAGVCVVPERAVLGEGERCDVGDVLSVCGPGLSCSGGGTCEFAAGADCASPVVVDLGFLDEGTSASLTINLQTLRENYDMACDSVSSGRVLELVSPSEGVARVSVSALRPTTVVQSVSSRQFCDTPSTESFCLTEPVIDDIVGLTDWVRLDGERGTFVFLGGEGLARLDIEFFRAIREGNTCSEDNQRACSGLSGCAGGTCAVSDGGTCNAPLNGIDLAGAPLGSTPLVMELPSEGLRDVRTPRACSLEGGNDVTVELVAPAAGVVTVSFLSNEAGVALELDLACPGILASPVCSGPGGNAAGDPSLEVYEGQRVYITVDGVRSGAPPVLLVTFDARRVLGEGCDDLGVCASGLICDEDGVCLPPRVGAGEPCDTFVRCQEGLACSAITRVCADPVAVGSFCDLEGVLVACPADSVCLATPVDTRCRGLEALDGQACAEGVACPEGSVCLGGIPGVWAGVCGLVSGMEDDRCDFESAVCADGLVCNWWSDTAAGFCRPTIEPGLGQICDVTSATVDCLEGVCTAFAPGSSVGGCIVPDGRDGDSCIPGAETCADGFVCNGFDDSAMGFCEAGGVSTGRPCDIEEEGGCALPLVCRYSDIADTEANCEPALLPGDECVPDRFTDPCLSVSECGAEGTAATCSIPLFLVQQGESCAENFFCDDALVCDPIDPISGMPTSSARCRPSLGEGETCTADPALGVCDFGLECVAGASGSTCEFPG